MLPGLKDLSDVRVKLWMVEEEVHCVLDALDPDSHRDVVVPETLEVKRLLLSIILFYFNYLFAQSKRIKLASHQAVHLSIFL